METLYHPADLVGLHLQTFTLPGGAGVFGDATVSPLALPQLDAAAGSGGAAAPAPDASSGASSGATSTSPGLGAIGTAVLGPFGALWQLLHPQAQSGGGMTAADAGKWIEGIAWVLALVILGILFVGLGAYTITKD